MIDRTHELPVARQCQILSLARSTAYYRPRETSEADLKLMRRIDGGCKRFLYGRLPESKFFNK